MPPPHLTPQRKLLSLGSHGVVTHMSSVVASLLPVRPTLLLIQLLPLPYLLNLSAPLMLPMAHSVTPPPVPRQISLPAVALTAIAGAVALIL